MVEAFRQDWERDPFTMIEEGDMYFGRGTLDTKLNVAAIVATFLRLKSEGFVPSRDIIMVLSGDEETSMATTKIITSDYRDQIDAEFAIVADGGGGALDENGKAFSFTVTHSEKTFASIEVTAHNPGGHSSRPRKDNAIYDISQAMINLSKYEFPVIQSELTKTYFEKTANLVTDPKISKAMADFAKNKNDKEAVATLRSYPQYIGATGTTCVATMLRGGHADNALPQSATATVNCRIFPGISEEETINQLKAVMKNDKLDWKVINTVEAAPESPLNEEVLSAVERAIHVEFPDIPIVPAMALGASDGKHFRSAGIPSYALTGIFIKASDGFSHGLNERVPKDNLERSMRIWHQLFSEWAG
ncbi:MAG: M20/M25/M40 family metallo-hydrolase [Emcibacteraceae bacterium]